jgi:hypothetical protein
MEGASEMIQTKLDEITKEALNYIKENKQFSKEQQEILYNPIIMMNILMLVEANPILLMLASTDPQIISVIQVISIMFFEIGRRFGKAELVNETLTGMEEENR